MIKYYRQVAAYPSIAMIALMLVYSVIDSRGYKSEWLTSEGVVEIEMITAFMYSALMCVLCLPILLVGKQLIRSSYILTAICWFLLPAGLMVIVIAHQVSHDMTYEPDSGTISLP